MTEVPSPGLANQAGLRTFFRIAGPLVLVVALGFMALGLVDFFGSMSSFEGPDRFWMLFVGIPLLAVGGWLSQAGYAGVAARYAAGELSAVVKDSASYLTDGEGLLGVGRTVDDAHRSHRPRHRPVLPVVRRPQRRRRPLL